MSWQSQAELWSVDPAGWAERAEARNRPLFEALLERVRPTSGTRLLDVGCGAGLMCEMALDSGAKVAGIDAAPGLLAVARERAPAASFVQGDLEALPFPDDSFDVVTAANVIPYACDRNRAITEIARVTSPGGCVAATVGAGRGERECAALVDPLAPPSEVPDWEHQLDVREPGALATVLTDVGLNLLEETDIAFACEYTDLDDAIAAQLPAGPVEAAIRHSGHAAVEAALRSFFASRVKSDGTVAITVSYRAVLARRPTDTALGRRVPR